MTRQAKTLSSPFESDRFAWLDAIAAPLQQFLTKLFTADETGRAVKSALNGTPIRHRVHPALITVPLGAWTTAALLDFLDARGGGEGNGYGKAADASIIFGIISAVPTAAAGLADWTDLYDHPRRVGTAHAVLNSAALTLYIASAGARLAGKRPLARALGALGFGVVTVGGALGGEMVYTLGVNVPHYLYPKAPNEWRDVLASTALTEGGRTVVEVERVPVLLVRQGGQIFAVEAWCPHAGGPLAEGTFTGETVECPWHQSVFALADGRALHGPASVPLRTFAVREEQGRIALHPSYEGQSWPPPPKPPVALPAAD